MQEITEDQGLQENWYEEASQVQTPAHLAQFVTKLTTEFKHDYGTICYAIASSALAAANCVSRSQEEKLEQFQAQAITWEFIDHWGAFRMPASLLSLEDLLNPEAEEKFTTLSPRAWAWVQNEAEERLQKYTLDDVSPRLYNHWKSISEGRVPFGLGLETDNSKPEQTLSVYRKLQKYAQTYISQGGDALPEEVWP